MRLILTYALFLTGVGFMFVAALGVLRMPDLLMRLHCSTKSATLGVGCVVLGAAFHFDYGALWARALALVIFVFVTAPVAAHMLGRAAYGSGVPLWEGTLSDELRGRYSEDKRTLASPPEAEPLPVHQESD